jgi:chromosome segregation ATPase
MNPRLKNAGRVALAALILTSTVALVSWKKQDHYNGQQQEVRKDTIPQQRERKVRDLDEAIEALDRIDLKAQIDLAMASVAETMKQIDPEKLHLEVERALKSVDMEKVKADVEKAMKEIDFEKIQAQVKESMDKVDWNEIKEHIADLKLEMQQIKDIDYEEMNRELAKAQEEIRKIKPELDKEIAKATEEIKKIRPELEKELAKAKVEIEKAKAEIREYKNFVDGLEKDGLLDTRDEYTIEHKSGKLIVNGKEASSAIYNKYKSFLDKHKKLNIKKSDSTISLTGDED